VVDGTSTSSAPTSLPLPRATSTTSLQEWATLPPLEQSDPLIAQEALPLSSRPGWEGWLQNTSLVQRFVAAVENVADGDSPRIHVPFLAPPERFGVTIERGRTFVDPAAYARYDGVANVIDGLDATATVRLYRRFQPLFEGAYADLGRPDRTFEQALRLAIARLLATPVVDGPLELRERVITYGFADTNLQSLSAAEKHLLRMGPRNVRAIQAKLRQIEAALDAP
jgi:hypothetical protein